MENLEDVIRSYSIIILSIATVLLLIIAGVSLYIKKLRAGLKNILFFSIVATVLLPSLFLIASTIYLNSVSSSGGPVHWHADIELWACGQELDIVNPTGLSNKVGTATLHEHNDKRIHLEGVVVEPQDASIGKFFKVIDGTLTNSTLTVPTAGGTVSFKNGQKCGNGDTSTLQVFVHTVVDGKYYQTKLVDPAGYTISPHQAVPPGDCIIIEFDKEKEATEKICRSFMVAEKIGKVKKGY